MQNDATYDIVIIGGGINGCGIAADAAGRGLSVLLVEAGDLAQGTSSASSKLIHGGLRYLEHYEFRLVREALSEREVLLQKAPHIIWPLRFVLPHVKGLRSRPLIRAGLFLYDHLYRRRLIPGSTALDLRRDPAGKPLADDLRQGFAYWDCWVDDARLVVLNARAAANRGAHIRTGCRMIRAQEQGAIWHVTLDEAGQRRDVRAKALVNAAGPWAGTVGTAITAPGQNARPHLRLVKGSHIILRRIPDANDAYLLQNADGRVVFALPYEQDFTLIGTTDIPYDGDPTKVAIDPAEETYLLDLAGRFFKQPLKQADIVARYSGVRPLYDDHADNPSAVTRDYKLDLQATASGPPLLTVLGGKVTTYRRLAEEAMDRLFPYLPKMGRAWTERGALPGGDLPNGFESYVDDLCRRRRSIDAKFLRRLARRHGSLTDDMLGDAITPRDLGRMLGGGLCEREVVYLGEREWARSADDVLWRRTKAGLHMTDAERAAASAVIQSLLATQAR